MKSEYGRVMPSAVELEEAVIGAILLDQECLAEVAHILSSKSFYEEKHRLIYDAIISLNEKSSKIDILTVTQQLKKSGALDLVGGPLSIVALTNRIGGSAHIESHARIIKQQHMRRELIYKASSIVNDAYNDSVDVFDILSDTEKSLGDITGSLSSKQIQHISDIIGAIREDVKQAKGDVQLGISSGLIKLDELTGGWNKSDLILLAARPGMGKTSLLLTWILNAAKNKMKCGVFSIEMSEKQIVNRMIAQEAIVSASRMRKNELGDGERKRIADASLVISKLDVYVDDSPSLSLFEFKAKVRRLIRKYGVELVVVDYLQLMNDGNKSRSQEQEISNVSKGLKAIAKEMGVPIIALSQLSRDVERRNKSNNRPVLSDLRSSGSLEQDADMVIFIYRPDYYDRNATDESGESLRGIAELIVAKNRHGATDTAKVKFEEWSTRFINLEPDEQMATSAIAEDMPF